MRCVPPDVEQELRWFFSESLGDLGLRSNFEAMISEWAAIAVGAPTTQRLSHGPADVSERQLSAAARYRRVHAALSSIEPLHAAALKAYCAHQKPIANAERILRVAMLTDALALAHAASRSPKPPDQWLSRLSYRVASKRSHDLPRDRAILASIRRAAERLLSNAARSFQANWRSRG